ncbi:MAG: hypothetical protein U0X73_03935 [Thermoanaerobaculia bacterium]
MSSFDTPLTLPRADVLHFLGYPAGREPRPRIADALEEFLAVARRLVRGRGVWTTLPPQSAPEVGLEPLAATGLAIGLVTAGGAIVEAASARLARGDATGALLLDACGSAAAEETADRCSAAIVAALAGDPAPTAIADGPPPAEPERAAAVSCRISPGYGRWPLAAQPALFARLPHREIGVRLEPSLLMVPRKSVSFAMWLGADARPLAGLSGCARCELESCRYRRAPRVVETSS